MSQLWQEHTPQTSVQLAFPRKIGPQSRLLVVQREIFELKKQRDEQLQKINQFEKTQKENDDLFEEQEIWLQKFRQSCEKSIADLNEDTERKGKQLKERLLQANKSHYESIVLREQLEEFKLQNEVLRRQLEKEQEIHSQYILQYQKKAEELEGQRSIWNEFRQYQQRLEELLWQFQNQDQKWISKLELEQQLLKETQMKVSNLSQDESRLKDLMDASNSQLEQLYQDQKQFQLNNDQDLCDKNFKLEVLIKEEEVLQQKYLALINQRDQEIQALTNQLQELQEVFDQRGNSIQNLEQSIKDKERQELERAKEETEQLHLKVRELGNIEQQVTIEGQSLKADQEALMSSQNQLEQQIANQQSQEIVLEEHVNKLRDQEISNQDNIQIFENSLQENRVLLEEKKAIFEKMESDYNIVNEECDKMEIVQRQLEEVKLDQVQAKIQVQQALQDILDKINQFHSLEQSLESRQEDVDDEKEGLEQRHKEVEDNVRELQRKKEIAQSHHQNHLQEMQNRDGTMSQRIGNIQREATEVDELINITKQDYEKYLALNSSIYIKVQSSQAQVDGDVDDDDKNVKASSQDRVSQQGPIEEPEHKQNLESTSHKQASNTQDIQNKDKDFQAESRHRTPGAKRGQGRKKIKLNTKEDYNINSKAIYNNIKNNNYQDHGISQNQELTDYEMSTDQHLSSTQQQTQHNHDLQIQSQKNEEQQFSLGVIESIIKTSRESTKLLGLKRKHEKDVQQQQQFTNTQSGPATDQGTAQKRQYRKNEKRRRSPKTPSHVGLNGNKLNGQIVEREHASQPSSVEFEQIQNQVTTTQKKRGRKPKVRSQDVSKEQKQQQQQQQPK